MSAQNYAQAIVRDLERQGYTLSGAQRAALLGAAQRVIEDVLTTVNASYVETTNAAYEEAAAHLEMCERSSLFARRVNQIGTLRAAIEEVRSRKLTVHR